MILLFLLLSLQLRLAVVHPKGSINFTIRILLFLSALKQLLLLLGNESLFFPILHHLLPFLLPAFHGRVHKVVELEFLFGRVL